MRAGDPNPWRRVWVAARPAARPAGIYVGARLVVLVAACAWAAAVALRRDRDWRSLAAPLLAPLGIVVFFVFLWQRTGEAGAWFSVQRHGWNERIGLDATWDKADRFFEHPFGDVNTTVAVFGTVFVLATLYPLLRARLPGPVVAYTVAVLVPAVFSHTLGARPRFLLAAFPLIVVLARYLKGTAFSIALACSATLLGSFTVMSLASRAATP